MALMLVELLVRLTLAFLFPSTYLPTYLHTFLIRDSEYNFNFVPTRAQYNFEADDVEQYSVWTQVWSLCGVPRTYNCTMIILFFFYYNINLMKIKIKKINCIL